jgi:LuxR family maltose regulon positive regulatory protein/serine/threonine-protein kinase PknK
LLEASRELGAECGVVDFMLASFGTLARIRAVQGDTGTAFELLDEGRAVAERLNLPRLKARMIADQIGLLLETGRVREALRVAQSLPDGSACHGGIGTLVEWTRTATLGRVLSAEGNHAAAIGLLEALVERTTAAGHPLWEVRAALRLACAHQAGRFAGRAEATLAPVLRRGAGAGLLRTVLDAGPEIADILPRLAGRNPADAVPSEYLARLLALSGATPAPDPTGPRGNATLRSLSGQELQIVRMLERGLSNKEIAHDLRISVNTVKWYLKNIYTKLGVTNRAQSVFALRQGDL